MTAKTFLRLNNSGKVSRPHNEHKSWIDLHRKTHIHQERNQAKNSPRTVNSHSQGVEEMGSSLFLQRRFSEK